MKVMKAKYLMITHWENHWDNIKETHYSTSMLRDGMQKELIKNEPTTTIFIKLNEQTRKLEKAWIGTAYDFEFKKDDKDKEEIIYFRVDIQKEIPDDKIPKEFLGKSEGWYFIGDREIGILEENLLINLLYPLFFYILIDTKDWKTFEDYTYYLLKLIGINEIYKFENQKGEADGFFKIGNLAVIYDTTLDENFESNKATQIENYVNQLQKNPFPIPGKNIEISINQCTKEVWIITRTREKSKIIGRKDDIYVKEVSIYTLFDIFNLRLKKINNERELEEILRSIGK